MRPLQETLLWDKSLKAQAVKGTHREEGHEEERKNTETEPTELLAKRSRRGRSPDTNPGKEIVSGASTPVQIKIRRLHGRINKEKSQQTADNKIYSTLRSFIGLKCGVEGSRKAAREDPLGHVSSKL